MASGYRPASGPVTAFGRTASHWWKRAVALILDAIILSIPISILTSMSGGGFERTTVDGETRIEWHGGGLFVGVIVGLLYYALLNGGAKGQTIGKMALRIQVRDIDTGGPIGVGRGFGRQLMRRPFGRRAADQVAVVRSLAEARPDLLAVDDEFVTVAHRARAQRRQV